MTKLYFTICLSGLLVLSACSGSKATADTQGNGQEKERIILHNAEDLKGQVRQENRPLEFQNREEDSTSFRW